MSSKSFRRCIKRIARAIRVRWERGMIKVRKKVRWSKEKLIKPEVLQEGSIEEWL